MAPFCIASDGRHTTTVEVAMNTQKLRTTASGVLALVAMTPIIWAVLIVFVQCLGWLKHAVWQPVPGLVVLITPEQQNEQYRLFQGRFNALDLVPGFGSGETPSLFGDKLAGGEIIFWWFIELPFALHLVLASMLIGMLSASVQNEQ